MADSMQPLDFRESFYERPNQEWRCGRTREDKPCLVGPSPRGRCQATFECRPMKKGDRWHCARSVLAGGPCDQGPLPDGTCSCLIPPCRPIRNWRARLRVAAHGVAALSIGLLLIVLGGSGRLAVIEPGDLTFQHSGVTVCGDCHTVSADDALTWPGVAFGEPTEIADSKRCLACHQLGGNSLSPHSMPAAELALITERGSKPSAPSVPMTLQILAATTGLKHSQSGKLPCMTCHREHKGKSADLADVSNRRCMSCHQTKFASLSDGHPEFTDFPFNRSTRIAFNHATHFDTHFHVKEFKDDAPSGCNGCHAPDVNGETMLIKEFEVVCSDCHTHQIEGKDRASAKGIEVLNVPGIDTESLADQDVPVGGWPAEALDAETELTPIMDFLLSADPEFAAARKLLADVDVLDLSDAEPEHLEAAATIAWAVKEFFFDLSTKGMPALEERLQVAIGRGIDTVDLAKLSGLLPVDAVRSAAGAWFPQLHGEVSARRRGKELPPPVPEDDQESIKDENKKKPVEQMGGEAWSTAGGWYRDEFSLFYRPTGHEDALLRAWLNVTGVSAVGFTQPEAAREIFELLADPKAPGRCVKCHSVDAVGEQPNTGFVVNWTGTRPVQDQQKFTRFSHRTHFSLLDEKGCLSCHSLGKSVARTDRSKTRDPKRFVSNFGPIKREACATCHRKTEAGDRCLTCHEYHIGVFPPAMVSAPMVMTKSKAGTSN